MPATTDSPESIVIGNTAVLSTAGLPDAICQLVPELDRSLREDGSPDQDDLTYAAVLLESLEDVCDSLRPESLTVDGAGRIREAVRAATTAGHLARHFLEVDPYERRPLGTMTLRPELIRLAAVALQWAACLDRRIEASPPTPSPEGEGTDHTDAPSVSESLPLSLQERGPGGEA